MVNIARVRSNFHIHDSEAEIIESLPAAVYTLRINPESGPYLEKIEDLILPSKVYGSVDTREQRVIQTYNDRPAGTGVLLSGKKGSGKTLLMRKIAATLMHTQNQPVIVINRVVHGDMLGSFIQKLNMPVTILFDEFEKVYDEEDAQRTLLTLLDGVYQIKALYIFSVNHTHEMVDELIARPGRIYYKFNYDGLDDTFITEYLDDTLIDKTHIEELTYVAKQTSMTFDEIKAVVEELNRYGGNPSEVIDVLNISSTYHLFGAMRVKSVQASKGKVFATIPRDVVDLSTNAVSIVVYLADNPGNRTFMDLFTIYPDVTLRDAAIGALGVVDNHDAVLERLPVPLRVDLREHKVNGTSKGQRTIQLSGGVTLCEFGPPQQNTSGHYGFSTGPVIESIA